MLHSCLRKRLFELLLLVSVQPYMICLIFHDWNSAQIPRGPTLKMLSLRYSPMQSNVICNLEFFELHITRSLCVSTTWFWGYIKLCVAILSDFYFLQVKVSTKYIIPVKYNMKKNKPPLQTRVCSSIEIQYPIKPT